MKPLAMLTRLQLARRLAQVLEIPLGRAQLVINTIIDSMIAALQRGDRIEIRGFGVFRIDTRPCRIARNPRTGAPVQVSAKKVIRFRVAQELGANLVKNRDEVHIRSQLSAEYQVPVETDAAGTNAIKPACCGPFAAQRTRLSRLRKEIETFDDQADGALVDRAIMEIRKIEKWLAAHSHAISETPRS